MKKINPMKKMNHKMIVAALVLIGFGASANAQSSASATASATIVTPLSIVKNTDMNFGNVAVQATNGGIVQLAPDGSRTRTGGVTLPAATGTVSAASFTVTGNGSYTYSISLPSSVTLKHASSPAEMIADAFTSTPSGTGVLTAGTQDILVGASLNVAASQLAGVYTSENFDVTVNYN
jgi:hypothetical protein